MRFIGKYNIIQFKFLTMNKYKFKTIPTNLTASSQQSFKSANLASFQSKDKYKQKYGENQKWNQRSNQKNDHGPSSSITMPFSGKNLATPDLLNGKYGVKAEEKQNNLGSSTFLAGNTSQTNNMKNKLDELLKQSSQILQERRTGYSKNKTYGQFDSNAKAATSSLNGNVNSSFAGSGVKATNPSQFDFHSVQDKHGQTKSANHFEFLKGLTTTASASTLNQNKGTGYKENIQMKKSSDKIYGNGGLTNVQTSSTTNGHYKNQFDSSISYNMGANNSNINTKNSHSIKNLNVTRTPSTTSIENFKDFPSFNLSNLNENNIKLREKQKETQRSITQKNTSKQKNTQKYPKTTTNLSVMASGNKKQRLQRLKTQQDNNETQQKVTVMPTLTPKYHSTTSFTSYTKTQDYTFSSSNAHTSAAQATNPKLQQYTNSLTQVTQSQPATFSEAKTELTLLISSYKELLTAYKDQFQSKQYYRKELSQSWRANSQQKQQYETKIAEINKNNTDEVLKLKYQIQQKQKTKVLQLAQMKQGYETKIVELQNIIKEKDAKLAQFSRKVNLLVNQLLEAREKFSKEFIEQKTKSILSINEEYMNKALQKQKENLQLKTEIIQKSSKIEQLTQKIASLEEQLQQAGQKNQSGSSGPSSSLTEFQQSSILSLKSTIQQLSHKNNSLSQKLSQSFRKYQLLQNNLTLLELKHKNSLSNQILENTVQLSTKQGIIRTLMGKMTSIQDKYRSAYSQLRMKNQFIKANLVGRCEDIQNKEYVDRVLAAYAKEFGRRGKIIQIAKQNRDGSPEKSDESGTLSSNQQELSKDSQEKREEDGWTWQQLRDQYIKLRDKTRVYEMCA